MVFPSHSSEESTKMWDGSWLVFLLCLILDEGMSEVAKESSCFWLQVFAGNPRVCRVVIAALPSARGSAYSREECLCCILELIPVVFRAEAGPNPPFGDSLSCLHCRDLL